MASDQHPAGGVSCSFCGKHQREVRKVIAGPDVYICDECVSLCSDICAQEADAEERARAEAAARRPAESVEDSVPDWLGTVLRAARRLAAVCLETDVTPAIRVRAEDLAKALDRPPPLPGP